MPKRRKHSTALNNSRSKRARLNPKRKYVVARINDFRIAPNTTDKLEINVSWEGFSEEDDCWLPFSSLYLNTTFKEFVRDNYENHKDEISVIMENVKQRIKLRIKNSIRTKLSAEIMLLEVWPFDCLEFLAMKVICLHMKDTPKNMRDHLDNLAYKNYFFELERAQEMIHKEMCQKIREIEEIDVVIENLVDFDTLDEFTYIAKNIIPDEIKYPANMIKAESRGCACKQCGVFSGCCPKFIKKPFSYRNVESKKQLGLKYEHNSKIIECGAYCECNLSCNNRLTQRNPHIRFCLFKTFEEKGWGLKTRDSIKKGTFILEYRGEMVEISDADQRDSKYIFETQLSGFTLDAGNFGSLARFVSHSCNPNAAMCGVNDCMQEPKNERLCLFALRDIEADEEITFDYRPGGSIAKMPKNIKLEELISHTIIPRCLCKSAKCRKVIF